MTFRHSALLGIAALSWTASPAVAADPYARGERFDVSTLPDRFREERRIDESVRVILFSRDMRGGEVSKDALDGICDRTLCERDAVYVSDLSGMPRVVTHLFALPALRRRDYALLIDHGGRVTERIPAKAGHATLLFLEALRITRVLHLDRPEAVREALALPELR